jgi:hypothetical protein
MSSGGGEDVKAPNRDFKTRLKGHITDLKGRGVPVPEDDVAAVKFLKVDLHAPEPDSGLV